MPKLRPNQFTLPSGKVISEIPLLFQTEMVKAILDGRKTQTRRTRGLDEINKHPEYWNRDGNPMKNICRFWNSRLSDPNPLRIEFGFKQYSFHDGETTTYINSPYGKPGDLLWVRESFQKTSRFYYKADFSEQIARKASASGATWKPSIHMPKSACRIWLMVESIGVERVRYICGDDAIAEGVQYISGIDLHWDGWRDYELKEIQLGPHYTFPSLSFQSLWKSINGKSSWDSNPWVWVIKFRVLSKTGRPSEELIAEHHQQIASPRSSSRNDARKEVSDV